MYQNGKQKQLPNLLHVQDEKVHSQITIRPGECGLAFSFEKVMNTALLDAIGQLFLSSMIM